jgi:hypothetical protein
MPSKSISQARLMAAVAHNPAFAKKAGIPVSVGEKFNAADEKTGILKKKRKGTLAKKTVARMKPPSRMPQPPAQPPVMAAGPPAMPQGMPSGMPSGPPQMPPNRRGW